MKTARPADAALPLAEVPEPIMSLHPDLTESFLLSNRLLPLGRRGDLAVVGTWGERPERLACDRLALLLGSRLHLVLVDEGAGVGGVRAAYGRDARTAGALIETLDTGPQTEAVEAGIDDVVTQAQEPPVIRLVNMLLLEAIEARASDVHVEQRRDRTIVRYRIDGVLVDAPSPPRQLAGAIVSRLKIMAQLDIAERRLPQDGRIALQLSGRQLDVRVSTLPSLHGESVVLRLLGLASSRLGIDDLGMPNDLRESYLGAARQSHGIVLVTGPTGSGKTTTLYATLDAIRTGSEKILTVEDPVEYELPGAVQVSIRPKIGLTFASSLRALLRQDPDIMLVGEIRDRETAEIAIHAALTGHLVFSTLHTNDAVGALTRLVDLGVEPFLVASTTRAVLAQRLLRTNCPGCALPADPNSAEKAWLGRGGTPPGELLRGRGCERCRGTGYLGRTGIYELLVLGGSRAARFAETGNVAALRAARESTGVADLTSAARRLARTGRTTPAEAMRMTG